MARRKEKWKRKLGFLVCIFATNMLCVTKIVMCFSGLGFLISEWKEKCLPLCSLPLRARWSVGIATQIWRAFSTHALYLKPRGICFHTRHTLPNSQPTCVHSHFQATSFTLTHTHPTTSALKCMQIWVPITCWIYHYRSPPKLQRTATDLSRDANENHLEHFYELPIGWLALVRSLFPSWRAKVFAWGQFIQGNKKWRGKKRNCEWKKKEWGKSPLTHSRGKGEREDERSVGCSSRYLYKELHVLVYYLWGLASSWKFLVTTHQQLLQLEIWVLDYIHVHRGRGPGLGLLLEIWGISGSKHSFASQREIQWESTYVFGICGVQSQCHMPFLAPLGWGDYYLPLLLELDLDLEYFQGCFKIRKQSWFCYFPYSILCPEIRREASVEKIFSESHY